MGATPPSACMVGACTWHELTLAALPAAVGLQTGMPGHVFALGGHGSPRANSATYSQNRCLNMYAAGKREEADR